MTQKQSIPKALQPHLSKLKRIGTQTVLEAGCVLKKHFQKKLRIREKKNAGLVTHVDLLAEETALKILKRSPIDLSILTEESGLQKNEQSQGLWILDPLDGTTNYAHGLPIFCVALGLFYQNRLCLSFLYHPIWDELYTAELGSGAFLNRKRMRVSRKRTLSKSLLSTGFSYQKERSRKKEIKLFKKLSMQAQGIRRAGSAALDLALVARGVFDGFWEQSLAPWDMAAGTLLVEEAGGVVTDFQARGFSLKMPSICAGSAPIHRALLKNIDSI